MDADLRWPLRQVMWAAWLTPHPRRRCTSRGIGQARSANVPEWRDRERPRSGRAARSTSPAPRWRPRRRSAAVAGSDAGVSRRRAIMSGDKLDPAIARARRTGRPRGATSCAWPPGSPSAASLPWATQRRSARSWMPTCSASPRCGRLGEARSACSRSRPPACATSAERGGGSQGRVRRRRRRCRMMERWRLTDDAEECLAAA